MKGKNKILDYLLARKIKILSVSLQEFDPVSAMHHLNFVYPAISITPVSIRIRAVGYVRLSGEIV